MGLAVQNFDIPIFFAHCMTHGLKYRSLKNMHFRKLNEKNLPSHIAQKILGPHIGFPTMG